MRPLCVFCEKKKDAKKKSRKMNKSSAPWTEKYRPHTLRGVANQNHIVNVLQSTLCAKVEGNKALDVPNLLFYGPPGTGKTTTISAIARQWFPTPELFRERVLEMNASDERGIESVRRVVIAFARQPVLPDPQNKLPPFRLLILDEADAMTEKAQASLRRVMERYSTYTRFCLLCNYLSGLITPLISRCAVFYFKAPSPERMFIRLNQIAERENLAIGEGEVQHKDTLLLFAQHSDGDMRKALHWMQCLKNVMNSAEAEGEDGKGGEEGKRCPEELAKSVLYNLSARPPDLVVTGLVVALFTKRLDYGVWYKKLYSRVFNHGYSIVAVLQMMCEKLLDWSVRHPEHVEAVGEYLERLSEIDAALHKGADGQLQLLSLFHPLVIENIKE